MIDTIYQHQVLSSIVRNCIEDEGIEVEVGETLLDGNGDLNDELIVILKPDEYYSTRNGMKKPPKSIDNLVMTFDGDSFHLYLMEMKSSSRVKYISKDKEGIYNKFKTIIDIFFKEDFSDVFQKDYKLESLNLWLVCNPFSKSISKDLYRKKIGTCGLDAFQSMKPFSYKGKIRLIKPVMPTLVIENDRFVD